MKIQAANLTLYNQEFDDIELELSPTQLEVVFNVLNIKFNNNGTYSCRPDEYLKKIVLPAVKEIK